MEKQKKPYPMRQLWHWYNGDYCCKKCRGEENSGYECWQKMEGFCDKNPDLKMTHREFIDFFARHVNICKFDEKERRRMPTWKEVVLREGECQICKKLGIKQW